MITETIAIRFNLFPEVHEAEAAQEVRRALWVWHYEQAAAEAAEDVDQDHQDVAS
jgi:hypothetical protein